MFIVMSYLGHHNKRSLHQYGSNFYISIMQNLQVYYGTNPTTDLLVNRHK